MLGSMLVKKFGPACLGVDLPQVDVTVPGSIQPVIDQFRPDVIINAAALTDVDHCETHPVEADRVNRLGVGLLAETGIRLIAISTDQVFTDGGGVMLDEQSPVNPVNEYAAGKLRGEKIALENPENCVVRTSWLMGDRGMIPWMGERLTSRGEVSAVTNQTSCITLVDHLADALEVLAFDKSFSGLYHCVNPGAVTPFFLACLARMRIGRGRVVPVEWEQLALPAKRPVWSALGTRREITLPPMEEAIEICLRRIL